VHARWLQPQVTWWAVGDDNCMVCGGRNMWEVRGYSRAGNCVMASLKPLATIITRLRAAFCGRGPQQGLPHFLRHPGQKITCDDTTKASTRGACITYAATGHARAIFNVMLPFTGMQYTRSRRH
jgi:hypothetical protein